MSTSQDAAYNCTLSPEVLEKAKKELNENPETRLIEVKNLRARLEKIPGLKARTDIKFLLTFLRARKFEQERAFQLVKNYYEIRRKDPQVFDDLKPSRIKHVIDDGVIEVLEHRDNNGCKVVVLRIGNWNPDRYPLSELPRALSLVMMKLMEEEETQVHGVHIINNLGEVTWKQASNVNPSFAKRAMHLLQDVVPMRLKRIDYVKEPTFFDVIFTIIKQFMKEKLTKRIVLNGEKLDKLHATISPDFLPTDLGGKLPMHHNKEFISKFLASDQQFEEDNRYGYVKMGVDTQKKENQKADADISGLGGTFKKLDV